MLSEQELGYIISSTYDGRTRKLYPKTCSCGKTFYVPLSRLAQRKHCSSACTSESRKKQVQVRCETCGTLFTRKASRLKVSKSRLYFCSRRCKDVAQSLDGIPAIQPSHYGKGNGMHDYRERALRYYGPCCQSCGYLRNTEMIDVDHIDGNRLNNDITNLQVLCVWCHALKTRGIEPHSCPGSFARQE